jgi:hypothetical protein
MTRAEDRVDIEKRKITKSVMKKFDQILNQIVNQELKEIKAGIRQIFKEYDTRFR